MIISNSKTGKSTDTEEVIVWLTALKGRTSRKTLEQALTVAKFIESSPKEKEELARINQLYIEEMNGDLFPQMDICDLFNKC